MRVLVRFGGSWSGEPVYRACVEARGSCACLLSCWCGLLRVVVSRCGCNDVVGCSQVGHVDRLLLDRAGDILDRDTLDGRDSLKDQLPVDASGGEVVRHREKQLRVGVPPEPAEFSNLFRRYPSGGCEIANGAVVQCRRHVLAALPHSRVDTSNSSAQASNVSAVSLLSAGSLTLLPFTEFARAHNALACRIVCTSAWSIQSAGGSFSRCT